MSDDTSQDPEVEFSPLSRSVTRDGVTLRVFIYRVPEISDLWALEVVDANDASTVWDSTFDTDEDALDTFEEALAAQGIRGLTETLH